MIKTFTAEGMTPELAFNNQAKFDIDMNATRGFIKANVSLEEYAKEALGEDPIEGLGYYVVIRPPKKVILEPKYKVVNHINKTVRKWATKVNLVNAQGTVLESYTTKELPKAKAIARAKVLATDLNSSITIVLSKELLNNDNGVIAEIQPKENNPNGRYFFFGVETTDEVTDDNNG